MRIDKEYILNSLRSNLNYLREEFGVPSISLFGSFARGKENDESNIDLFVDMPPDLHKLLGLIEFLENYFKRKVDIRRNREYLKERFFRRIQQGRIIA